MMRNAIVLGAVAIGLATAIGAGGGKMKITTTVFQEGGNIPSKFTCDGADANPPLRFEGVPAEAKSLALIVDDPDAPGGLFTHWLVWNIDPKTTAVEENGAPSNSVQGKNDFGKSGYGGPCPPSGTHRYFFKIFALDRQLDLAAGSKRAQLDAQMRGHIIAQGELMGRYSRGR
jgi:Raf kinase inhibitor-like YbhB/YbcL family protein